jgi:hypothetical protein
MCSTSCRRTRSLLASLFAVRRVTLIVGSGLFIGAAGCGGDRFSSSQKPTGTDAGVHAHGAGGGGGNSASNGGGSGEGGTSGAGTGNVTGEGGTTPDGAGGMDTGPTTGGRGAASGSGGAIPSNGGAVSVSGGTTSSSGGTATSGGNAGAGRNTGGTASGGSAGAGGAITAPHWCDGQTALFCEDFDEVTKIDDFLNSWTTVSTVGATFSFDSSAGVPSSPNALRIRTTSSTDVKALAVRQLAPFATRPSKIRLEFDLRIDAGDTVDVGSGAAFAAILTGTRVSDGIIGVEVGPGPAVLAGYIDATGTPSESALSGAFPTENQWLGRYAIEVTYSTGAISGNRTGCVQVLVGGTRQLPQCLALPPTLIDPPFVSVAFGVYGGGFASTGDVQLRFDNVVLTAQ